MGLHGFVVLAGAVVGLAVGLTGMGGGALMTPVLVLLLGVSPAAAVSSDLVASVFMKPVGSAVHIRRRTVHWPIVRWLAVGSVPSGFLGAYLVGSLASGPALSHAIELALGSALAVAVAGVVGRSLLDRRKGVRAPAPAGPIAVRRVPTLVVGVLGGLVVGTTSVGSGSLMIVALMYCYPALDGRELVGTDLVQSIPLVASAALGQALFGQVRLGVTISLLVGALPAIYLGSRLSASTSSSTYLRPVITAVLAVSSLKLLGVGDAGLGVVLACGAAAGTTAVALRAVRARRRTEVAAGAAFTPAPDPRACRPG